MSKKLPLLIRAAFAALLVIFQACSPCCREWLYDEVCTSCPYYNSKRIILRSETNLQGLELEFIRTFSGQRAYINIFSLALPRDINDPLKTQICISFGDNKYNFYADRLEGGQRLLLSKEAEELIISQLLECKPMTISTGRYRSVIIPRKFPEAYKKFTSD